MGKKKSPQTTDVEVKDTALDAVETVVEPQEEIKMDNEKDTCACDCEKDECRCDSFDPDVAETPQNDCDCCKDCNCGDRNYTTYEMPCAVGDEVFRVTPQGDDYGNVSYKVQKGRVVAMRIDEKGQIWLQVDFGTNLPATMLLASEYDYNTYEVGQRLAKFYR